MASHEPLSLSPSSTYLSSRIHACIVRNTRTLLISVFIIIYGGRRRAKKTGADSLLAAVALLTRMEKINNSFGPFPFLAFQCMQSREKETSHDTSTVTCKDDSEGQRISHKKPAATATPKPVTDGWDVVGMICDLKHWTQAVPAGITLLFTQCSAEESHFCFSNDIYMKWVSN